MKGSESLKKVHAPPEEDLESNPIGNTEVWETPSGVVDAAAMDGPIGNVASKITEGMVTLPSKPTKI